MSDLALSLSRFLPEVVLTTGVLLVVLVDAARPRWRDAATEALAILALAGALLACLPLFGPERAGSLFLGAVVLDPLTVFFKVLLILAALVVALAFDFRNSRELRGLGRGEFYALLLALTLSNLLLAAANDLSLLYLALEMVSISSYVLVAYVKGDRLSNEASLKYLLFGTVSTGTMLYGFSLLYGLAGTTSLPGIQRALASGPSEGSQLTLYIVALLVFVGFGFKTAAVPFHFWCPDVYQGAPTPVTALLSVAPKTAGFAILLRFFYGTLSVSRGGAWELSSTVEWPALLMVLSVLTMTVGNVAALTQTNLKRLLAYSSIAHAGYVLMGVVALTENGARGVMVYLLAYLVMNLGAFLVVHLVHDAEGTFDLRDYPGLHRRAPGLTLAMAVFLLSLMGIPPLVGFLGKFYVFAAVVERGPSYYWFAVAGALNAAVAACYYARVLKTMVIDAGGEEKPAFSLRLTDRLAVGSLAVANLVPILFWSVVEGWVAGVTQGLQIAGR